MDNLTTNTLIEQLLTADNAYHNGCETHLTDAEYDRLKAQAKELLPDDPYFKKVGAPPAAQGWLVEKHTTPMGSILNIPVTNREQWADSVIENTKKWMNQYPAGTKYLLQLKLDGLSLEVNLKNGTPTQALLRGDGHEGENILANFTKMHLPTELAITQNDITTVRGELLISTTSLELVNRQLIEEGSKPYKSRRAAVAGIIRRLDGRFSNVLQFRIFDIRRDGEPAFTRTTMTGTVKTFGVSTIQDIADVYYSWIALRAEYMFAIDGLVIKVADEEVAFSGDPLLPDGMRALKFPPEEQLFRVDSIEAEVGKTGRVNPVVVSSEGTQFEGKQVKKITAHNWDYLTDQGIGIGSDLLVVISMDVIPKIEKVHGTGVLVIPTHCPRCNTPLVKEGKYLLCTNSINCLGIREAKLHAFLKGMGIEGIGPETVAALFKQDPLMDPARLYLLKADDLLALPGVALTSAANMIRAIWAVKEVTLAKFISALSIPGIGESVVEKTGAVNLQQLMALTEANLTTITGIGPATASALVKGLQSNRNLLLNLATVITIKSTASTGVQSNLLEGKSFCFTGDTQEINYATQLPYTREELHALTLTHSGLVKSGVSKKVDIVVTADLSFTSSKITKAKELGIPIITTRDYLQMINKLNY